jgi:hypothetical protein
MEPGVSAVLIVHLALLSVFAAVGRRLGKLRIVRKAEN